MKYTVVFIIFITIVNTIKIAAMDETKKNRTKTWFIDISRDIRKKKKERNPLRERPISSELIINAEKIHEITASNNTEDIIIPHKQIVNRD